jgi:hypothetical protein
LKLCGDWAAGGRAKLRMHTAQTLVEALCEEVDSSCLPPPPPPPPPRGGGGGPSAEESPRREAAVRLQNVLKSQYAVEKSRAERVS